MKDGRLHYLYNSLGIPPEHAAIMSRYSLCGKGLCIGDDGGNAVTAAMARD